MPPQNVYATGGDQGLTQTPDQWQQLLRRGQPADPAEPQTAGGFGMTDYAQFLNGGGAGAASGAAGATGGAPARPAPPPAGGGQVYGQPATKAMFDQLGVNPSDLGLTVSFNTASPAGRQQATNYFGGGPVASFGQAAAQAAPSGGGPGGPMFSKDELLGLVRTAPRFDQSTGTVRDFYNQNDLATMLGFAAKQQEEAGKFAIATMNNQTAREGLGVKNDPATKLRDELFKSDSAAPPNETPPQRAMRRLAIKNAVAQNFGPAAGGDQVQPGVGEPAPRPTPLSGPQRPNTVEQELSQQSGRLGDEVMSYLTNRLDQTGKPVMTPGQALASIFKYDQSHQGFMATHGPEVIESFKKNYGPTAFQQFLHPGVMPSLTSQIGNYFGAGRSDEDLAREAFQRYLGLAPTHEWISTGADPAGGPIDPAVYNRLSQRFPQKYPPR